MHDQDRVRLQLRAVREPAHPRPTQPLPALTPLRRSAESRRRLGVVGWPVAHSRSPAMQNAALRDAGLVDWRYQLLPVPPEVAGETLRAFGGTGLRGVNVTIPHKAVALSAATDPTARARAIGAANTLLYEDDGRIVADNTDAPALIAALPRLPSSALVLGAGGSARAAVWALRDAGVDEVRIWNRTPERARTLAGELGATPVTQLQPAQLLVNCTAVGLHGEDPFAVLPLTPAGLGAYPVVADYVYAGVESTQLVAAAQRHGATTIDGLELLVLQGALAFERFTGLPGPLAVMRRAARAGR